MSGIPDGNGRQNTAGKQGNSGHATVVKRWSNVPYLPSQNPMKPHQVQPLSRCKKRKGETCAKIGKDFTSGAYGLAKIFCDCIHRSVHVIPPVFSLPTLSSSPSSTTV